MTDEVHQAEVIYELIDLQVTKTLLPLSHPSFHVDRGAPVDAASNWANFAPGSPDMSRQLQMEAVNAVMAEAS